MSSQQHNSHKTIGILSSIFISVSAAVGSGWLYSSYFAAKMAGGGAVYAWIIAAVLFMFLGLIFAEIAGIYPKRGLIAVVPTLTHNNTFALPFAISAWLGLSAVVALEATATIEYMVQLFPGANTIFFDHEQLTTYGTLLALFMVMIYTFINFWGAKMLTRVNNVIVVFKLIVPALTAILLVATAYNASNFTAVNDTMIPYGTQSIMTAIIAGGLITTFNGLQVIVGYASEVKNPKRNIPIIIVISSIIVLSIYLLLQIAFIGALTPEMLANGWHKLNFEAPMVQLVGAAGLGFMVIILYSDAMVSPMGTAVTDLGAATRTFTAMARSGQMPKWFDKVDPVVGVSRRSLFFNVFLAMVCIMLFHSWDLIAQVLSLLHIVSYMPILLALSIFRKQIPKKEYGFRMPLGSAVSLVLFTMFCYLFTVADETIVLETLLAMLAFQVVYIFAQANGELGRLIEGAENSWIIFGYFFGLYLLNYFDPERFSAIDPVVHIGVTILYSVLSYFILTRVHLSDSMLVELEATKHQT